MFYGLEMAVAGATSTAKPLHAVKSPGMSASHTLSTPLKATFIDDEDCSLPPRIAHAPAKLPSTTPLLAVPIMNPPSADRVHPAVTGVHSRPLLEPLCRNHPPPSAPPATAGVPANPLPELYFGNVPFNAHLPSKIDEDKIAAAFHNSSRKTLNFIHLRCKMGRSLSTVASGIGRPLYPDAITRACTRLDFARVCIMLNVNSKLPKHVVIMMPNELGGESACKVDVEYEWLPPKCTGCASLGHSMKECSLSKQTKPAVAIYVRKPPPPTPAAPELKYSEQGQADLVPKEIHPLRLRLIGECTARIMAGLIELAVTVGNVPWLVGGDFNAVLDMSEVSGASGDIRVVMNEFNDCILQIGLLSMPMQGERFTWHNCSLDGRSLWKRLDRLLVNDVWMDRWPNLFYTCLTPRTSDHSLLVLKGDCRNIQPVFWKQRRSKGDLAMNVKLAAGFLEVVQNILQFDRHNSLLLLLEHCCRLVYLKASKLEQVMLRQRAKLQWLKGGDQCSKVFFRRVATRRANKRIFQISDDEGNEQTEPTIISSIFVDFFQGLLGGDRTDRAIDLRYLRPWARHILMDDEARAIIRPVTIDEVKTALFDIEEDKAPGPDGFSSGFFKAAWPVVGEEVSKAIMDFFKTGRLLKQLNATLLTLIPKVRTPHSVAEFRPISCCNVVYKVISKIIVSRIREILDLLISPSQNAFVPGRLISDNILLAQELFSGYNQCRLPPRCALKVDLRKAYDTVEWDFLIATLRLFGFPAVFIRWIEECVTSAHYSVVVNGGQLIEQDGEFQYHWRCKDLNLFQLSFADDLLLFCKADVRSEGHLPVRYLGLPLISARLSVAECQPLLQKIDSRIKGGKGSSSPLLDGFNLSNLF
ncbi:hypothetical protein Sango_3090400 [Sesamum angolense]|uniref:Reverse transcriptase domain-containing protein n=1 Tax=Sesamum angolense TaxID=2727404 RepID=A0AAE1W169_9LAMI|nr:hypothetical protein Sango_3090400 [Sesamum angolense]